MEETESTDENNTNPVPSQAAHDDRQDEDDHSHEENEDSASIVDSLAASDDRHEEDKEEEDDDDSDEEDYQVKKEDDSDKYKDPFNGSLKSSFYNGTFSDLTIIVNGETIKAHKVIVDSQSNLLEPYVHQQRSRTSTLILRNFTPLASSCIRGMIGFMYGCSYEEMLQVPPLTLHSLMYTLAIHYDFLRLQRYTLRKFVESAKSDTSWDTNVFIDIVVWSRKTNYPAIRTVVLNICRFRIREMLLSPRFMDLTCHDAGFATELMLVLQPELDIECLECFTPCVDRCPNCDSEENWRWYFYLV